LNKAKFSPDELVTFAGLEERLLVLEGSTPKIKPLRSLETSVHTTKHEMNLARAKRGVVSRAVRGTALYSGD
jgi:hypothetical protein